MWWQNNRTVQDMYLLRESWMEGMFYKYFILISHNIDRYISINIAEVRIIKTKLNFNCKSFISMFIFLLHSNQLMYKQFIDINFNICCFCKSNALFFLRHFIHHLLFRKHLFKFKGKYIILNIIYFLLNFKIYNLHIIKYKSHKLLMG